MKFRTQLIFTLLLAVMVMPFATATTLMTEDYEDGILTDWSGDSDGGANWQHFITVDGEFEGSRYVNYRTLNVLSERNTMQKEFANVTNGTVRARAQMRMFIPAAGMIGEMVLSDNQTFDVAGLTNGASVVFDNGSVYARGASLTLLARNWSDNEKLNVTLDVHIHNQTFDIYINGTQYADGLAVLGTVNNIDVFSWAEFDTSRGIDLDADMIVVENFTAPAPEPPAEPPAVVSDVEEEIANLSAMFVGLFLILIASLIASTYLKGVTMNIFGRQMDIGEIMAGMVILVMVIGVIGLLVLL